MKKLNDKNVVVIGGSRDVGRTIAVEAYKNGATVLAIARNKKPLEDLEREYAGIMTEPIDASTPSAPDEVFTTLRPDVLVLSGGAIPPKSTISELNWEEFSLNWNSDVQISFRFIKAALQLPLAPGTVVILISSGAAIGGSLISGGFAAAKRAQMFMANYAQAESDKRGLGIRFIALAPLKIMPGTELGKKAVEGYVKYLGIPEAAFLKDMNSQSPEDVAHAVIDIASTPDEYEGTVFTVSAEGVDPVV